MTEYRVEIFCTDCTGQDPMGCFDGGSQILCESERPYLVKSFTELEQAKDAGYDATEDTGPWEFKILDNEGNYVYNSRLD